MNNTTGVVRKIDDLGRIVIPKEIRKILRIKNNEPLEISVNDEQIILKKYSTMKDYLYIIKSIIKSLSFSFESNILITDRDVVIDCSKELKTKYLNKIITKDIEKQIIDRKVLIENVQKKIEIIDKEAEFCSYIISPIIANGDIVGSIILISGTPLKKEDEKIVSLLTNFLSGYIEE